MLDQIVRLGGMPAPPNGKTWQSQVQDIVTLLQANTDALRALQDALADVPELPERWFGPLVGYQGPNAGVALPVNLFQAPVSFLATFVWLDADTSGVYGLRIDNEVIPFQMLAHAGVFRPLGRKGIYIHRGAILSIDTSANSSANVSGVIFGIPQVSEV